MNEEYRTLDEVREIAKSFECTSEEFLYKCSIDCLKENHQLKDRIEKAIEYIEEEVFGMKYGNFVKACGEDSTDCDEECEHVVNLLKGE